MKVKLIISSFILFSLFIFLSSIRVFCMDNNTITLENTNVLRNSDLDLGLTVNTLGYYNEGDGGNAVYIITDTPEYTVDNIFVIPMQNGKYAQMIFSNDSIINVACAGVFPNTNASDALNSLISLCNGKVAGLQFNNGVYIIDSPISLESLIYKGAEDTTISVSKDFQTNSDKVIYTSPNSDKGYTITIDSIDFLFETTINHTLHDKESIFLALHNTEACTISNCSIIAQPASTNGDFMPTTPLWFRFSDYHKNIALKNCQVKNLTGSAYKGDSNDVLIGGAIWVTGKNQSSQIQNVLLDHVYIETSCTDEALGLWNGIFTNISISDCSIQNHSHLSHNVITLCDGQFNDVNINNTNLNIHAPTCYIIKTVSIAPYSNIVFSNCSIFADNNASDKNNYSVVSSGNGNDNTVCSFNNCSFEIADSTKYMCVISAKKSNNSTYNFNECTIYGTLTYGFAFIEDTNNINLSCISCSINSHNVLMNLKRAYNSNLYFQDNSISSMITSVISTDGYFNYTFSDNIILSDNPGTLIATNNVGSVAQKSNLAVKDNSALPMLYYSNCNISSEDFMNITTQ